MPRGTTRKSISIKGSVFHRLTAYQENHEGGPNKSSFLEGLLEELHPEVFGEGAPLPPPPTEAEQALTRARQRQARERIDSPKEVVDQIFPGMSDPKPSKKHPKTLQPSVVEPSPKPEDPDDFPTGIVMF